MAQDLLRSGPGRFWRGNLHCHSDRSDGVKSPVEVAAAYRSAGYDFIALSDHFEERYGWRVTDTRGLRTPEFTTLLAAELSSGPWNASGVLWVTAVGLPLAFAAPPAEHLAEGIGRAHELAAFVVLLHPRLNNLEPQAIAQLPYFDAVEIYNHNNARTNPDSGDGAYMVDGLLERGRRVLINAGDDAHFEYPGDRFGGWVEVWAEALDPEALLAALRAGAYYSTQGPRFERLELDGPTLLVETGPVHAIALSGPGERWLDGASVFDERGGEVREASFDLSRFAGSFCRVTVVDPGGRRAWSNPIWP
jgi:hypothetical protein